MSRELFLTEWTKCELIRDCDKCVEVTRTLKANIPYIVLNWYGKIDWNSHIVLAICQLLKEHGTCVDVKFTKIEKKLVSALHIIFAVECECVVVKCSKQKHLAYHKNHLVLVKHVPEASGSGCDQGKETKEQ
jgi:hypothetical protein